jgi:hypothetical protein
MDFVGFLFKMNFRLYSSGSGSSSGRGTGLPFAVQFHYFSINNTNYHLFWGRGCSGSGSGGGLGAVVVLRSGVPVALMGGMSPITLIPVGSSGVSVNGLMRGRDTASSRRFVDRPERRRAGT